MEEDLKQNITRDFKGVWIPKVVWLDGRLNALDKVILTEIDSLDQGQRGCYASNKHIAEFCQCSESKVSKSISKLIELGYLYVQNFDGRQRELKSCLAKFTSLPSKIYEAASQNLLESNIDNNTDNNTNKKERKKDVKKPSTYDSIIEEFTDNEDLKTALYEFIKMRKLIKKPMTDNALKLLLQKLTKLSGDTGTQIEILEQSILNNWQGIFPLKADADNFSSQNWANGAKPPTSPRRSKFAERVEDEDFNSWAAKTFGI